LLGSEVPEDWRWGLVARIADHCSHWPYGVSACQVLDRLMHDAGTKTLTAAFRVIARKAPAVKREAEEDWGR
jgi:hypothetical protein